ncbi:hypothetical protein BC833DRAFT_662902 [Globomyces pollinis-pini]|nr:hypothetical protein BC833DRAFT_662902 [Globomyces pollinis-pini]
MVYDIYVLNVFNVLSKIFLLGTYLLVVVSCFKDIRPSDNRCLMNVGYAFRLDDVISYKTYLQRLKTICQQLDLNGRWGAQSGRKKSYLFGTWAGASDTDLMQSAQHKTVQNAVKYKLDASFIL